MSDLVKRARDYLATNAAESGADALIAELASALEGKVTSRFARELAWERYKRGVQDTVDALRAGIAGMSESVVPKSDILKFCEFTEQQQDQKLPSDFAATIQ